MFNLSGKMPSRDPGPGAGGRDSAAGLGLWTLRTSCFVSTTTL